MSRQDSKEVTDDVPASEDANVIESSGGDPDELSHVRGPNSRRPTVWGRAGVSVPFAFCCYIHEFDVEMQHTGIIIGCYSLCIMFIIYKFRLKILHCFNISEDKVLLMPPTLP